MSVLNKLTFLFSLFFIVSLLGCGGDSGGSSGNGNGNGNGGEYSGVCPKISVDGDGGEEKYPFFLPFDSKGATLYHTVGKITFNKVTSEEVEDLKDSFTGVSDGRVGYYTKCNIENGMHAVIEYDLSAADKQLELSLFGNGGFIPDSDKFEEVFELSVAISSPISFFYVKRDYNEDMSTRFDNYIAQHDAKGYSCGQSGCRTDNKWFNIYSSKSIDWHIDYSGN